MATGLQLKQQRSGQTEQPPGGDSSGNPSVSVPVATVMPTNKKEDPLAPLEWNEDASAEEVSLAFLNVVEFDQEDLDVLVDAPPSVNKDEDTQQQQQKKKGTEESNAARKRHREDLDDDDDDDQEEDKEGNDDLISILSDTDMNRPNHVTTTTINNDSSKCKGNYDGQQAAAKTNTIDERSASSDTATGTATTDQGPPKVITTTLTKGPPRVSRRRKKKPKGIPKRPLTAFGIFHHEERQKILNQKFEFVSEDEIMKQVGKLWRSLTAEEIKKYELMAEKDRVRYHEQMEVHTASTTTTSTRSSSPGDSTNAAVVTPKDFSAKTEDTNNISIFASYHLPPPAPAGVMVYPVQVQVKNDDSSPPARMNTESPPASAHQTSMPAPAPVTASPRSVDQGRPHVLQPRWGHYGGGPPPPPMPFPISGPYVSPVPSVNSPTRKQPPAPPSPFRPDMYHGREVSSGSTVPPSNGGRGWHSRTGTPFSPVHSRPPDSKNSPNRDQATADASNHSTAVVPCSSGSVDGSSTRSNRSYSPHFGRPARVAYPPPPPPMQKPPPISTYTIPPGMEMALPKREGGEQKYRVTYKCFTMQADQVQGFLEGLSASAPQHHPNYHYQPPPEASPSSSPPRPYYAPPPPAARQPMSPYRRYPPQHYYQYFPGPPPAASW